MGRYFKRTLPTASSDNEMPVRILSPVRDTFRLLLGFAQKSLKKAPAALAIADLDAPFIGRFLDHVEKDRGNTPQTRNVRLAAIHSFFSYLALQEPSLGALAQRVLAIPGKRHKSKPVDFLTRPEIDALLAAPDQSTWSGRRDRTLLLVSGQRPQGALYSTAQGCGRRSAPLVARTQRAALRRCLSQCPRLSSKPGWS